MKAGPLMQVWTIIRRAQGAVTLDALVQQTGLDPDLVQSAVDWLVRQGRLRKVGEAEVCAVSRRALCRWCGWRARCPVEFRPGEG